MTRQFTTLLALAAIVASSAACSAGVASEDQRFPAPRLDAADLAGAPTAASLRPQTQTQPQSQPQSQSQSAPPPLVLAHARDEEIWCDISLKRTAYGVRITPRVRAGGPVSGEYSLAITKSGRSGSSDISQGGPFDAPGNVRLDLGSSEVSLERGASFRAVLKVRSGGREVCREIRS